MTDRNYELLYEEYGYQEELCNEASVLGRKKWGKKCVRKAQMITKVYYQKTMNKVRKQEILQERKVKVKELQERKRRRKCTRNEWWNRVY